MGRKITLNLDADTDKKLTALSSRLGYSREMAAIYAVRLIHACMREGLLDETPARAWPQEAAGFAGSGARVLTLERKKSAAQGD